MFTRTDIAIEFRRMDRIDAFLEQAPERIMEVTQVAYDDVLPDYMYALQDEPVKQPQDKIDWTSVKQHRKFWASGGFGRGPRALGTGADAGPTERRGIGQRMVDHYVVRLNLFRTSATITTSNDDPAMEYIVGSLDPRRHSGPAGAIQQIYLIDLDWRPVSEVNEEYRPKFRAAIRQAVKDLLQTEL